MRIDFGPGEWVDVIPVNDLKVRHQDAYSDLLFSETPLTPEGQADRELIEKEHDGGFRKFNKLWMRRRNALIAAIVLTGWSYGVPRPAISEDGTKLLNRESMGEANKRIADVIDIYYTEFEREPDPKALEAATTTSSGSPSKARAHSPKE